MIGIEKYAYTLGKKVRTVEEITGNNANNDCKMMRNQGLDRIPTDNDRLLIDMIREAYWKLGVKPDCILIAHSLPFVRTDDQKTDIDHDIPVYWLSGMPCAIMHRTMEIAAQLIKNQIYQKIVVIGADKAYSDRERVFFGTIMGDGVVALLISEDAAEHHLISSCVSTTILATDGENSSPGDIAEFRSKNIMMMCRAISVCARRGSVDMPDFFVTHTSNRTFWDGVAAALQYPRERFRDENIQNTGHMNSHDSFYHYLYLCERGEIKQGQTAMLINPGFGGTQGCTLLRR